MDSSTEVRVVVTGRARSAFSPTDARATDLSAEQVLACGGPHLGAPRWTICGGEPTLRPDLPTLLTELSERGAPPLWLWTDGLPLTASVLASLPVVGYRIGLHSHDLTAHDWLVGRPGAGKRALRALRAARQAGYPVEIDACISRPCMTHLVPLVSLAERLGTSLVLRRPPIRGPESIAVSPRLGLLYPHLEAAVNEARRRGVSLQILDLPDCVSPVDTVPVSWIGVSPTHYPGCAGCSCAGAPADYVDRFGWSEIRSTENAEIDVVGEPVPLQAGAAPPPPRSGRFPATRVAFARSQAARASLGGDPMLGTAPVETPDVLRVQIGAPPHFHAPEADTLDLEPTRAIKKRMVGASQQGARKLRIANATALAHPDGPELLWDATRLSFEALELCTEASRLDTLSERSLRRLKGFTEVWVPLFAGDDRSHDAIVGVGTRSAALRGAERLGEILQIPPKRVAIVRGDTALFGEVDAVRLSPVGGSLRELARHGESYADVLAPVLPPCLLPRDPSVEPAQAARYAWTDGQRTLQKPSGTDRLGSYNPCPHAVRCGAASRCPGLAVGWLTEGIHPL